MYYNGHLSFSISTLLGLFSLLHLTTAVGNDINLKHIIDQYVDLCGRESICNKDLLTTPGYTEKRRINISCPVCSCEDKCRIQGDCCPDFASNTCVQTSFKLVKGGDMVEYFMKNDCPQDADEHLVRRCQETNTDENVLRRYPVTSKDTNMTYSNVQCARCNQDFSVLPWLIQTDCNVERMSFSNVDEFWKSVKTLQCYITYVPPHEIYHFLPKRCNKDDHLIANCNATGTASDFDKHVVEACKTTNLPIGEFKNPFCVLCNIQEKSFDPLISTCNVTGKLKYIEEQIVNQCLDKGVDLLAYPYKNVYCEKCNFKYTNVNLNIQVYNKFHTVTDDNNISKPAYLSIYTIRSFNFSFNSTLSESIEIRQELPDQITEKHVDWINIRNIWCRRENISYGAEDNGLQQACSCKEDCNKTNSCCNDPNEAWTKRLSKTWGCVGTTIPRTSSSGNRYFMINKCRDSYNNDMIKRLCASDDYDNYLSFIPVTDVQSLLTYKNFFCFLCVSPNTPTNLIVPWTFSMLCPVIFNFKNEESLESVIKYGLSRQCTFNLVPSSNNYVPDICGGWGGRSLYCSFCYPNKTRSIGVINVITGVYRSIFSLIDYTEETVEKNHDGKCSNDFDQDECRKLVCNSRKTLVNGICKTMISFYRSLTYNVAFQADVYSEIIMEIERYDIIQKIISFVIEDLIDDSDSDILILKYYYRDNRPCDKMIKLSKFNPVSIEAFLMISIRSKPSYKLLDSDMIEYSLYNATSKTRSWGNISMNSHKSIHAWFLPISNTEMYSTSFCYNRIIYMSSFDYSSDPGTDITELLFCPQVLLDPDKYTISSDGMQAFVRSLNRTFYYNEFFRGVNNSLHICAIDFTSSILALTNQDGSPKRSEYPLALQVISIFFTCISLIALCITFIVYCILKKLRTIPGQNMMSFVGSLFFAQLFSLLKDFFHVNTVACEAVGILTYYFWLSVFTTANVCCFHMCRVFVCNAKFQNKLICSPTVVWYMIYSFSVPFLLTIITIGCHVILSPSHLSGFGGYACFTLDRDTLLFAFIIPISVICFVNFILFSVTFYKIHDAPIMETANSHCRNDLFIYFKLFLLTGTAWVFQIIDGLFPVSPFSYLVTIFNALQGLYIMVSFVLNDRVKNMFRELGMYERFRFLHVTLKSSQGTGSTQLTQRTTASSNQEYHV